MGDSKAFLSIGREMPKKRPVRELANEMTSLSKEQIDEALDPARQTKPPLPVAPR